MRMNTHWTRHALTAAVGLSAALAACEDANPGRLKAQCATPCPDGQVCVLQAGAPQCVPAIDPPEGAEVSRPGPVEDAEPAVDAAPVVDATPTVDTAVEPPKDASPPTDAAPPALDAVPQEPDAAPPVLDAAPPEPDAVSPEPDAAAPELDAVAPPPPAVDAAPPELDAAAPELDAAAPPPPMVDAAPPPPAVDAALPPPPPPACPRCGPLGLQNDFGPAARVTALDIPGRRRLAAAAGCNLVGDANGTALGFVIDILGLDFQALVTADPATGVAPLTLLSQVNGWDEGETLGSTGPLEVPLMIGRATGPNAYQILRAALGPNNTPVIRFVGNSDRQGNLTATAAEFELVVPTVVPFTLTLTDAELGGTLNIGLAGVGFDMSPSHVQGYWRAEDAQRWLAALLASCAINPVPACGPLEDLLGGPDQCGAPPAACPGLATLVDSIGGYDARIDNGQGVECDPLVAGDCDALAVCLATTFTGTTITGYTP